MGVAWSPEQVLALAPDASSAKSGKELASARQWVSLGRAEDVVWGECQGSGSSPYQTKVDLSGPAFHCSCPSRKFPCKHGLGLLLLYAGDVSAVAVREVPAWVSAWREGRAKRAEEKASKEQEKKERIDRGEAVVDAAGKRKRGDARKAKVAAGLEELALWLADLARQGLAAARGLPPSTWEERARRLIDAQAPGVARRILQVASLPMTGVNTPSTTLERLGQLHLLIEAFRRIDTLLPDVQADVCAAIGFPVDQDEVRAGAGVRDVWRVVGQRVEVEDRLRVQRTWFSGRASGRVALLLDFTHVSQPRVDSGWPPGVAVGASLAFFPGSIPLRAVLKERHGEPEPLDEEIGQPSVTLEYQTYLGAIARSPWLELYPMILSGANVQRIEAGWSVRDAFDKVLPLSPRFEGGWDLLALSGGRPLTLVGEFDGSALMPIATVVGGQFRPLAGGDAEVRPAASRPVEGPEELVHSWQDAVASASVGVDRRPFLLNDSKGPLAAAARGLEGHEPAARLFGFAALASAYGRGGHVLIEDSTPLAAHCEPDDQPECAAAASQRLHQMLDGRRADILPEWLGLLAGQCARVADGDVVRVLNLGAGRSELRASILPVLGRRGRWLASQKAEWGYVGGEAEDADPENIWQTGKKSERQVALRALRTTSPERGRSLLESTFVTEPADDRASFLRVLETGLGLTDEAFLEAALDDRSKPVRRAAADLLARLPGSALSQRMLTRAVPILTVKRKLLGIAGSCALAVNPPAECPLDWDHDGIEPGLTADAKNRGFGERAWWLAQVMGAVPPGHWPASVGQRPESLIKAASGTEWADALIFGWTTATVRHRDAVFAEALLRCSTGRGGPPNAVGPPASLMGLLPAARREALLIETLRGDTNPFRNESPLLHYLQLTDGVMSEGLGREILASLGKLVARGSSDQGVANEYVAFWWLQNNLGRRLPVVLAEEARERSDACRSGPPILAHMFEQVVECLIFRREMHEECAR